MRAGRTAGLVLALSLSLLACTETPPPAPELDAEAAQACSAFEPLAGMIRSRELEGPELYRELQDVWNVAQRSDTAEVREAAQTLLTRAIQGDEQATNEAVTTLQQACNLPFS